MEFIPFVEVFPASHEDVRSILVKRSHQVPVGEYCFMDSYCNDPTCDCRRTMVFVVSKDSPGEKVLATLSYGWESFIFYKKWMMTGNKKMIQEFKGPALVSMAPQSHYAPFFLKVFSGFVSDKRYVNLLKTHYRMFKGALKEKK